MFADCLISFRLQCKTNGRTHIRRAADMDTLSVGFHDMFTDGKPEPRAAPVAAAGRVSPVKTLKNPRKMLFFNTDPVVTDFNQYMFFVRLVYTGHDGAVCTAIFACVLDEVGQDHSNLLLVCKDRRG